MAALIGCALAHWRLKLALFTVLSLLIVGGYVLVSHHAWGPAHAVPVTWVDRHVPCRPGWLWAYQSLYLLTGTVPWLARTREQLRRYTVGLALLTLVAFATFALYPTASPRPADVVPSAAHQLLFAWDGPYAAFPSLHAGFLLYTLATGRRLVRRVPVGVMIALLAWSAAILYATLAIREHYFVDLVAGAALGLGADAVAWRGVTACSAA